jgi:hypothetical protein
VAIQPDWLASVTTKGESSIVSEGVSLGLAAGATVCATSVLARAIALVSPTAAEGSDARRGVMDRETMG